MDAYKVGEEDAGDGSHGPAGIDSLALGIVREDFGVGTDAEWIETIVTGHGALQVLWWGGTWVPVK